MTEFGPQFQGMVAFEEIGKRVVAEYFPPLDGTLMEVMPMNGFGYKDHQPRDGQPITHVEYSTKGPDGNRDAQAAIAAVATMAQGVGYRHVDSEALAAAWEEAAAQPPDYEGELIFGKVPGKKQYVCKLEPPVEIAKLTAEFGIGDDDGVDVIRPVDFVRTKDKSAYRTLIFRQKDVGHDPHEAAAYFDTLAWVVRYRARAARKDEQSKATSK